MISFELSEEQRIVQSTLSEFAREILRPASRRLDEESRIDEAMLRALWSTEVIQSQGEITGEPRSRVTNAIILEELAAGDASLALALASTMGVVQAIADQGSTEQRAALLPLFTGAAFRAAAVALMEPSFGLEVLKYNTKATRSGETYTLSGAKTQVPLASRCSHFLVVAECDGAPDVLIVPSDAAGVRIGSPPGALGLRPLEMAKVSFEDVEVPVSMRLGEGNGADVQKIIDSARVGLSCIMAGLSRGILEYAIPYVKDRKVHGTALAQKQKVAFDIVDMHIDVEAMRWMNWKAAWEMEHDAGGATRMAQLAYTYASRQTMITADNGVQTFGGHGFVREHPIELWYRNARSLGVLEGIAGV
jgi:alkylation response protein AidB-like acyl-CoA dehydrogenase